MSYAREPHARKPRFSTTCTGEPKKVMQCPSPISTHWDVLSSIFLLTGKQAADPTIYAPLNDKVNWRAQALHISPQLLNFIDKLMAPRAAEQPNNTQEISEIIVSEKLSLVNTLTEHFSES